MTPSSLVRMLSERVLWEGDELSLSHDTLTLRSPHPGIPLAISDALVSRMRDESRGVWVMVFDRQMAEKLLERRER